MKEKRRNKKKLTTLIALLMCAILAFGIAGSLAYYTSVSEKITNKFSYASSTEDDDEDNLSIELTESYYTGDGVEVYLSTEEGNNEGTLELASGDAFGKFAHVSVSEDSCDCYVFLLVYDTLRASDYGDTYLNYSGDLPVGEESNNKWVFVASDENYYLYRYYESVGAGAYIYTGFDADFNPGYKDMDDEAIEWFNNAEMTFYSYAIQLDGVDEDTANNEAVSYYNESLGLSMQN